MKDEYPDSKSDLFAAFIERCVGLALPSGTAAMITMQSWMFLSSYEKLRTSLLTHQQITSMLHLGTRAFDSIGGEVVSSTAFVLHNRLARNRGSVAAEKGTFIRLVDGTSETAKIVTLRAALSRRNTESGYYLASSQDFEAIPGTPIVYWLSEKILTAFRNGRHLAETTRFAKGLVTADNLQFVREWYEVSSTRIAYGCPTREAAVESRARWFPYAKGGEFRRWFGNLGSVVNWENDGFLIQNTRTDDGSRVRATNFNLDRIFQPGVSWTVITSGTQSFRATPVGFLFDAAAGIGQSVDNSSLLALLNSTVISTILSALNPTLNLHPGYLGAIPLPISSEGIDALGSRSAILSAISKTDWDSFETSWEFERNPLTVLAQDSSNTTTHDTVLGSFP